MIRFHDFPVVVEPRDALSTEERELLEAMGEGPGCPTPERPFVLSVLPAGAEVGADAPPGARADIRWAGDSVLLHHETFTAELRPLDRRGTLRRLGGGRFPLQLAIETAACATLPLDGAIVLHAAAIVVADRACVFYGPSGIGKSTLARLSPFPRIAEELVVIRAGSGIVASAGECLPVLAGEGEFRWSAPVAAVFELARSAEVVIDRLGAREAVSSLLGSTLVYPVPALWNAGLGIVRRVADAVPSYRFGWSLQENAWEALREVVRRCP